MAIIRQVAAKVLNKGAFTHSRNTGNTKSNSVTRMGQKSLKQLACCFPVFIR